MDTKATPTDIIWARNLELKGAIVTLGPSNSTTTELPAKPPTTDERYFTTSLPAERGLTDSEYKAAWALVADINQYVEEGEDEFYLEPRWSTIDTVKQNELNEYRKAVSGTKLNPYDAINVYRGQSPKGRA